LLGYILFRLFFKIIKGLGRVFAKGGDGTSKRLKRITHRCVFIYNKLVKHSNILLGLLLVVFITTIFYFSRWIFFYKYEPEYYENWYYHSQWAYPQSARGISDGELYKFVGYRLAEGENPFNINYETPPFGKYLYGLSEKFLGNPYPVSILLYFSSLLLLYYLLKNLFDKRSILVGLLLFATTPFVATQVRETMLDLPLMVFFLAHIFFFLKYLNQKKFLFLALSGIFLGIASGTKLAVYTPFILVLDSILIFGRRLPFYWGAVILGYIIAFTPYFLKHKNPIPWLRLHEKTLDFYLNAGSSADYLNQWKSIFLNSYQGWWQTGKITLGDWSLILPIGVIGAIFIFYRSIKKKDKVWLYISGITLIFLLTNTFIPFWPRYLMPAIPLFILIIIHLFRKKVLIIFILIGLNLPFLWGSLTADNPSGDFEASARFMNTRAYRELYRSIDKAERKDLSEAKFIEIQETFLDKLDTRDVSVTVGDIKRDGNRASAETKITYLTKYGELTHDTNFEFQKHNGQWKMKWNWDYLWPGFTPDSKLIIEPESSLVSRKAVYIMPRVMFDWNKFLDELSDVTGESTTDLDIKIRSVVPDKYPRFVGFLEEFKDEKALTIPGVTLRDYTDTKARIFLEK
jgi:hypothetical protein